MLAIVFSLERFNQYTFGRHVHTESDHKPLEPDDSTETTCSSASTPPVNDDEVTEIRFYRAL